MSFEQGDSVFIEKLRKSGVIQRQLGRDLYEVLVGNVRIKSKGSDLRRIDSQKKKEKAAPAKVIREKKSNRSKSRKRSIDLHGLSVQEALDRFEDFLQTAVLDQVDRIEVIHGVGTGRLRKALEDYSHSSSVIQSCKRDESNPGVSWVYL